MTRKTNHKQKNISFGLIRHIEKFRKHLQLQENIKYGRKARSITFVEATSSPTKLAKFILEGKP